LDVKEKALEKINESILEIGTHLADVRKRMDDMPDSGSLKEMEKRIKDDLVPKMVERSDLELALKRMDELEAQQTRLIEGVDSLEKTTEQEKHDKRHAEVFRSYLLSNCDAALPAVREFARDHEKRAGLSEGTATEGGFLVPAPLELEMQKNITEIDPIQAIARVITLARGNSWQAPKRTAIPTAAKTKEKGKSAASSSTYKMIERTVRPGTVNTTGVSVDFLADVIGAEAMLAEDAAEAIAYLQGTKFVEGTDSGEPEGFTVNSDVATVTGTNTTDHKVSGEDFFALLTALKSPYRKNSTFVFNSTVLYNALSIRADLTAAGGGTASGAFILPFSLRDGIPNTIAGRPFVIAETMPDDGTQNNLAVAFADWKKAYWIAKRGGIMLTRDPYSDKPNLEFLWRFRYDGCVVRDEAMKILKMG